VSASTLEQLSLPAPGEASRIFNEFRSFVADRMRIRESKIVVAVSGGVDSTALLLLLSPLRSERAAGLDLVVAHFDHQLRGSREAAADKAYVEQLSSRLAVPAVFGGSDVREQARELGQSIEESARNLRYEFLRSVADAEGASMVAVGHTADDQVETVLHHIIRGAGIEGLVGMKPRREWPFGDGPQLIRPLLYISRRDTERYCRELKVQPREDPTNVELAATRNRIRHTVLPVMREINPSFGEAVLRLSAIASDQLVHLDKAVDAVWPSVVTSEEPVRIVFDRVELLHLERAVAARCIQRASYRLGGADLGSVHVTQILDHLSLDSNRRWAIDLPGPVKCKLAAALVIISLSRPAAPKLPIVTLTASGQTRVAEWVLETEDVSVRAPLSDDPLEAVIDSATIQGALVVRSRRPGDRLRPLGLGGEKKLQDVFVDAKVPREERDGVPIVVDDRGIVWVVGHCIDERVAVTAETRSVIQMKARRVRVDGAGRAR
jgi:tRNA(Ile)-lysidine synthase